MAMLAWQTILPMKESDKLSPLMVNDFNHKKNKAIIEVLKSFLEYWK